MNASLANPKFMQSTLNPVCEIRALNSNDLSSWIALRLALASESEVAMGCSYAEEAARPKERFELQLSSPLGASFGAFSASKLVGVASVMRPNELQSSAHKMMLWGLLVSPEFRRAGLGCALVKACAEFAALRGALRLNLTVFEPCHAAIALYESLGFHVYGREAQALCLDGNYYDALLMGMRLENA